MQQKMVESTGKDAHREASQLIASKNHQSSSEVSKAIHLDFSAHNIVKSGCVPHGKLSLAAGNDVIVYLKDGLLPSDEDLSKMIQYPQEDAYMKDCTN